ncbi:hypothetical protein [Paraflavitalea speifideaquila]|uniref:hypothetical protein n=1 Tax=Paraflavitalea speifideaquila TaxID=3076558 RepID=UPI0028EC136B|nr:hypothetical protein [Paraflavitalea speifideiaquila]
MKKVIIACLCFVLLSHLASAQDPFKGFTVNPLVFTAEDEITITVDVTGTNVAGATDVYIWTWANEEPGVAAVNSIVNTAWTNSPDAARFTPVAGSPNKFTFKLKGTLIFNLTPGQLKHFQFLVKTKDGGKQSNNTNTIKFDPLVFTPSMMRIFPARVGQNDVISLYFHQDLATSINEQRMTPVSATVEVFDNTGASAGQPLTLSLNNTSGQMWRAFLCLPVLIPQAQERSLPALPISSMEPYVM